MLFIFPVSLNIMTRHKRMKDKHNDKNYATDKTQVI